MQDAIELIGKHLPTDAKPIIAQLGNLTAPQPPPQSTKLEEASERARIGQKYRSAVAKLEENDKLVSDTEAKLNEYRERSVELERAVSELKASLDSYVPLMEVDPPPPSSNPFEVAYKGIQSWANSPDVAFLSLQDFHQAFMAKISAPMAPTAHSTPRGPPSPVAVAPVAPVAVAPTVLSNPSFDPYAMAGAPTNLAQQAQQQQQWLVQQQQQQQHRHVVPTDFDLFLDQQAPVVTGGSFPKAPPAGSSRVEPYPVQSRG